MMNDFTPDEYLRARKKAMQLLEHMDRTEKGLSDRLRQAGFGQEAVSDAMAYVESFGYIDDSRYARNYIMSHADSRSRQKIFQDLVQKGIRYDTIREAWTACEEFMDSDERSLLRSNVSRKACEGSRLDPKEMRRLYGYLLRRGFQYEDISHVLEEMDILCKNEPQNGEKDGFG